MLSGATPERPARDAVLLPRIGWDRLDVHPLAVLDEEALEVVRLWQLWRPAGLGGCGPLPYAGGTGDQPVILLDALAHCSRVAAIARERPADGDADRG